MEITEQSHITGMTQKEPLIVKLNEKTGREQGRNRAILLK